MSAKTPITKAREMERKEKIGIKEKNTLKLKYKTKHLPYFNELKIISGLQGNEYNPILKGIYYTILGTILRDKKIRIGTLKTDPRMSLTIPLPSGKGKKNLKICILKILKKMGYNVDVPLSLHSQQLIGKVINRGTVRKPEWIPNPGYLSRDYLIFDESYKLYSSKDEDIQESRRAIRISKDRIGDNLIEKKQVDNTFDDDERLSYISKVGMTKFLQPKFLPSAVVEDGDLRRDLILYVKGIADIDRKEAYKDRLKTKHNEVESLNKFCNYLKDLQNELKNYKFTFNDKAIDKIGEYPNFFVEQGFIHSEKGADFSKMVDYTLQDVLTKLSCCIGSMYKRMDINEECVDLAFMDLLEFFNMQLNFVKDKIKGRLDYGEGWKGAKEKDQECLEWLYNKNAMNEEDSIITIREFKKQIALIKGVSYNESTEEKGEGGQAVKIYNRFKKEGWINSKQIGQYDSKVWLAFEPKFIGNKIKFEGSKDSKGCYAYNSIISKINVIVEGVNPNNPNNPETIKEYEVDSK